MPRRRQGNRVLGPYPYRGKFRIIVCDEGGARVARLLETEEEAELTKAEIEGQLKAQVGRTIDEAIRAAGDHAERADRQAAGARQPP